jgi:hypothetical protein
MHFFEERDRVENADQYEDGQRERGTVADKNCREQDAADYRARGDVSYKPSVPEPPNIRFPIVDAIFNQVEHSIQFVYTEARQQHSRKCSPRRR